MEHLEIARKLVSHSMIEYICMASIILVCLLHSAVYTMGLIAKSPKVLAVPITIKNRSQIKNYTKRIRELESLLADKEAQIEILKSRF